MNASRMVLVALVVALVALGGNFFVLYENQNLIAQNNNTIDNQVSGLQATVASLQSTIVGLNSQLSAARQNQTGQAQEIASAQASLSSVEAQLATVVADMTSNRTSDLAVQGQIIDQLLKINGTLAEINGRLSAIVPSVPLSTLVIVSETYDSSSNTFTFNVRNNLNETVYAQLTAVLIGGTPDTDVCNGIAGSYTSQLLQFSANSTTLTQMSLSQGLYNQCGTSPITNITVQYFASQSVQVSLKYQFQVAPPYAFS